ncbi:hypothetical protein HF313_24010 [Massilia atriviolacea]|uniref:Uncharacterized protein n=1 Tax=Massilia atriviolacea TaxID=2495579 RepID=A0A430HK55_9BURK|nr:hypothetical protein [Massilia atriviolacea]RSZ57917.1 hypothetical protein EJB06_16475 [Massilia atriviolacea]
MRWCLAIAFAVVLGVAGHSIYPSRQIADLAARLPPAGVPAAMAPDRQTPAQVASTRRAGATTAPR